MGRPQRSNSGGPEAEPGQGSASWGGRSDSVANTPTGHSSHYIFDVVPDFELTSQSLHTLRREATLARKDARVLLPLSLHPL